MRTKIISILMALLLLPAVVRALTHDEAVADVSGFDSRLWNNVANCNAQLSVDGELVGVNDASNYTVLAYINGTLRGYQATPATYQPMTGGPQVCIYQTSIWADAATETGAAITFYVLDKGAKKVYKSAHTHAWAEGTLEMPSSGGVIEVSTQVPVTEIQTTNATVFAVPKSSFDPDIFGSSNYPAMFDWVVEMDPYYTVLPDDATNKEVSMSWDWENENYACEKGTNGKWYMFVAIGNSYTVTINALGAAGGAAAGPGVTADLTLTVKIPVTDIIPNNPKTYWRQDIIEAGLPLFGLYTVMPDEATDKSVTYELVTAKTTCAGEIYTNGRGTTVFQPAANGKGEVYINVKSVSNPTVSAEVHFTIGVKVTNLELPDTRRTISVGQQLTIADLYSITPADADATVTATSSDAGIVSVADGKLTGVAPGSATITFTVPTGDMDVTGAPEVISKSMTVTVTQPVTSITINTKLTDDDFVVWRKAAQTNPFGIMENVHYLIEPDNATNTAVTMEFVSGYENMGTLTEAMTFAGYTFKPAVDKKGEVKIKITSVSNPEVSAILTLVVKVDVESVAAKVSSMKVAVGSYTELADLFAVYPEDADNKALDFSVSSITPTAIGEIADNASGNACFRALAAGEATVTARSIQNQTISAEIVFTVAPKCTSLKVEWEDPEYDTTDQYGNYIHRLPVDVAREIKVTPLPEGCLYDFDNFHVRRSYSVSCEIDANDFSEEFWGELSTPVDNGDGTISVTFTPYVPQRVSVYESYTTPGEYEHESVCTLILGFPQAWESYTWEGGYINENDIVNQLAYQAAVMVDVPAGWSWVGATSGITNGIGTLDIQDNQLQRMFGDDLIEARTQNFYLVNDPTWGYFGGYFNEYYGHSANGNIPLYGDIDNGHIRVKLKNASKFYDGNHDFYYATPNCYFIKINKGWNWINALSYNNTPINEIISYETDGISEGDIIKGKDGKFATYTSGAWVGELTELKAGHAYSYYANGEEENMLYTGWAIPYTPRNAPRRAEARPEWEYDGTQFMTNMNVIAEMEQVAYPEDYTIGTFVGGECRGEGRYVDGRWFIFAHGEPGDVVSFKIKNRATGDIITLNESMDFAEIAGSYKAPVALTAGNNETTAIEDVMADGNVYVNGQRILGDNVEIFSIGGCNMTHANGHLAPGLYIVKSNGVTQKVTVK